MYFKRILKLTKSFNTLYAASIYVYFKRILKHLIILKKMPKPKSVFQENIETIFCGFCGKETGDDVYFKRILKLYGISA